MIQILGIIFIIVLFVAVSRTSKEFYEQKFKKNQKIFILAGIATFILHISANLLIGGYSPKLGGGLAILFWLIVILVQLLMWGSALIFGALALRFKNYAMLLAALLIFVLISIPLFLPLPGLLVK